MTKPNSVDAASLHPIVPRPLAEEVVKGQYAKCESFADVCQTFMEEDPQMRKFFGKGAKQ